MWSGDNGQESGVLVMLSWFVGVPTDDDQLRRMLRSASRIFRHTCVISGMHVADRVDHQIIDTFALLLCHNLHVRFERSIVEHPRDLHGQITAGYGARYRHCVTVVHCLLAE